jgi:RNA polymerase sigma-70 factor (ECF subfamily)
MGNGEEEAMAEEETPDVLRDELRTAWHRYIDMLAPLRPALHGYCRRLAGNVWDAEDLCQDTLLRAFGQLGQVNHEIRSPRAYLLRTATNVWIDELRRRETQARAPVAALDDAPATGADPETTSSMRAAGSRLLQRLAPQERAALVLKESFDMSLEEIADLLATTTGAVKAALHRGRVRLHEPEGAASSRRPVPSPELVDRFIERYVARDLKGLTELMLDGSSVENVGEALQFGREAHGRSRRNILYHVVHGHPEWPAEFQSDSVRVERALYEGEPILLWLVTRRGREALEVIFRFEEQQGRIARVRTYAFCPETMRAVGEALGLRVRTGLYRAPTPAPGEYWPAPA